jgi:hypothetical protein
MTYKPFKTHSLVNVLKGLIKSQSRLGGVDNDSQILYNTLSHL